MDDFESENMETAEPDGCSGVVGGRAKKVAFGVAVVAAGVAIGVAGIAFGKKIGSPKAASLLKDGLKNASEAAAESSLPEKIVEVGPFVRNRPDGWNTSVANKAFAASQGVSLEPGQSLVRSHLRTYHAA